MTFVVVSCTICFAVPNPGGQASIKPDTGGLPYGATPPTTIHKTSNVSAPLPTNKWFTSVLYNGYHAYSLKMYTYPQNFMCNPNSGQSKGIVIGYPKVQYSANSITYGYDGSAYAYPNNIKISGYSSIANGVYIDFDSAKLDGYSDFSATIKWEKATNWMKATVTQGSVFSFFEYDDVTYPAIEFPYSWESSGRIYLYKPSSSEPIGYALDIDTGNSDRIILETRFNDGRSVFYGIFVPEGTSFKQRSWGDNYNRIFIVLPNESDKRYFSIGLLPSSNITEAIDDLELYYKYAYNFITDTKVDWEVSSSDYSSKTMFSITTTKKRTDIEDQQDGTLFCLLPHQYNNLSSSVDYVENKTFDTLRGTLKLAKGSGFTTKTSFYGIVPFFQYNEKDLAGIKATLSEYLNIDNSATTASTVPTNTYHGGKVIAKLANMLPVADNLSDDAVKNDIIGKLKELLSDWFTYRTGKTSKYFAYDGTWGGLIGVNVSYGSQNYSDHNFHYGYFIYSAAILAMYDETFARDYGGMVDLLIKDIANTDRNDDFFPYMRSFDFYESHSWANGMGGADDRGQDQESSSEAMNAWSAIYLWGLATNNENYKKLGVYLYCNEYEAIKQYYFDINGDILKNPYNHNSIGILWGGLINYDLHFTPKVPQTIKGIQILPLTPAMTYLAYDRNYIEEFYNASLSEAGSVPSQWYDIWARLAALYDPSKALTRFNDYISTSAEEGSSKSFTYHFINFFNKYGTPVFTYTADVPSYMVLKKEDGTVTYCAYNFEKLSKNVNFYDSSGEHLGYLFVPAKSFHLSSTLIKYVPVRKFSVYPVPYKPASGSKYDAEGITFAGLGENVNIKIFNVAGEKVFEKTLSDSDVFVWNAKNNGGNDVASGIYIYHIKTGDGKKLKGKIAIER